MISPGSNSGKTPPHSAPPFGPPQLPKQLLLSNVKLVIGCEANEPSGCTCISSRVLWTEAEVSHWARLGQIPGTNWPTEKGVVLVWDVLIVSTTTWAEPFGSTETGPTIVPMSKSTAILGGCPS